MSKYTTGEIAKLCGVTVRTVQYYDTRNILVPSELTEGGRRLYSESDLKRMKIICFLREIGLSIDSIGQLLSEKDPGSVISLLLDQQEDELKKEIGDRETQLAKLLELRSGLKSAGEFSVDSIGDIAHTVTSKKELKKIRMTMLLTGIPLSLLQCSSIIIWITKGIWWPFLVWFIAAVPYGIWISRWYFRKTAYICPQCHTVFKPSLGKYSGQTIRRQHGNSPVPPAGIAASAWKSQPSQKQRTTHDPKSNREKGCRAR